MTIQVILRPIVHTFNMPIPKNVAISHKHCPQLSLPLPLSFSLPASDELFLLAAAETAAWLLDMSLRTLLDRDMETGMRLLETHGKITISANLF